jgi:cobalt-zinc-cadmium efflux system protein
MIAMEQNGSHHQDMCARGHGSVTPVEAGVDQTPASMHPPSARNDHNGVHHHSHDTPVSLKYLLFAMAINGGIVLFEMTVGLFIGSVALISDAVHNLSDIAHMIFSYWAEKVSRRPPNDRKTYGYRKIEFIAAFVNSIGLSVVIAFVFWESLKRFTTPVEVPGAAMLLAAVVAFLGNTAATMLLKKISAQNINIKSAWLHSLQDALFSLGVMVGALLIIFLGWSFVDPLISLVICVVIAREIYKIVRQTVNSLMDAVPPGIDLIEVRNDLLATPTIVEVNDLHIWQTGTRHNLLSAHLVSEEDSPNHEAIIRTVQEMLLNKHQINHATLQILPASAEAMEHCNHCN